MKPDMRNLIRKEWRERRLAFLAGCAWMLCSVVYAVVYERTHRFRDPVATFHITSLMYTLFAAIFLAMKISLGEQTQRTLGYSLALPISRQRLAWTRLSVGLASLLLPILLAACIMTPILLAGFIEQAPVRPPDEPGTYVPMMDRPSLSTIEAVGLLWTVAAIGMASGAQLLLLLSIFGARRRQESYIGFFGAVLAFGWTLLSSIRGSFKVFSGWLGAIFPVSFVINWGYSGADGNWIDLDLGQPV